MLFLQKFQQHQRQNDRISIRQQKKKFELMSDLMRRIPGKEEEGELLMILNQNRFRWVK